MSSKISETCSIEADFFARQEDSALIADSHVEEAIRKRKYRASLYEERIKRL